MSSVQILAAVHADYLPFIEIATNDELALFVRAQICLATGRELPELCGVAKALLDTHISLLERLEESSQKKSGAGKTGALKRWQNSPEPEQCQTEHSSDIAEPCETVAEHSNAIAEDSNAIAEPCDANAKEWPYSFSLSFSNSLKDLSDLKECGADAPLPAPEIKQTRRVFKPPSVEEVRDYCQKRGNDINAEQFVDFYTARDWVLSNKRKMADWEAAVRTWEKNGFSKPNAQSANVSAGRKNKFVNFEQRGWNQAKMEKMEKIEREYLEESLRDYSLPANEGLG